MPGQMDISNTIADVCELNLANVVNLQFIVIMLTKYMHVNSQLLQHWHFLTNIMQICLILTYSLSVRCFHV